MFNLFSNNTQYLDILLDILLKPIIAKATPAYANGEIDNLDIIERYIAFGIQEDCAQAGTKIILTFNKCDINSATGTNFDSNHINHVHDFASAVAFDDSGVYVRRGVGKTWTMSDNNSDELVKACASLKKAIEAENNANDEHIFIFRNNIKMVASSHNAKLKDSVFKYATKYATDQIFNALSKAQAKAKNKSADKPIKPQTPTKPSKQTPMHRPAITLDSVISNLKSTDIFEDPVMYSETTMREYRFPSTNGISVHVTAVKRDGEKPHIEVKCSDITRDDQQKCLHKILNIVCKLNNSLN